MRSITSGIAAFAAVFAVLHFSCTLFSLRPVEEPLGLVEDRLNLGSILAGTGCFFRSNVYEDIFSDQIVYDNNGYGPITTSRTKLVRRLTDLSNESAMSIVWEPGRFADDVKGDSATFYRKYVISFQTQSGISGDSGTSEFRMVRSPGVTTWAILLWKDESLTPSTRSVFNPER